MDPNSAPAGKSTLVALSLASMLVAVAPTYAQDARSADAATTNESSLARPTEKAQTLFGNSERLFTDRETALSSSGSHIT
jgi:hypothetical protein